MLPHNKIRQFQKHQTRMYMPMTLLDEIKLMETSWKTEKIVAGQLASLYLRQSFSPNVALLFAYTKYTNWLFTAGLKVWLCSAKMIREYSFHNNSKKAYTGQPMHRSTYFWL